MTNWKINLNENGEIDEIRYEYTDKTTFIFKDGMLLEDSTARPNGGYNCQPVYHYEKRYNTWTRTFVELPKDDVKKAKQLAYRALKKYTVVFE